MFEKSYKYYDIFKKNKNYELEVNELLAAIKTYRIKTDATVLDITCGTGEHDKYLAGYFHVDGLDINTHFLEIARKKNPKGNYYQGNMIDFDLKKQYDILICLYGGIGYTKNNKNLKKTLQCFDKHLKNKGLIIINPWYTPMQWKPGIRTVKESIQNNVYLRMSHGKANGDITFHYLIGEQNGILHFTEEYQLGLFEHETIPSILYPMGYKVRFNDNVKISRGLFIATKQ